jgi:hypothetical protein
VYAGDLGPGGQGGMSRARTTSAIRLARDETSRAVANANGAIPPIW